MEKLFWVRSSQALGIEQLTELPEALAYCYGSSRWLEFSQRLGRIPLWIYGIVGLVLVALLGSRPRFHRWLDESAVRIRRISSDRYSHTLVAFVATALLAAPVPMVLAAMGWALRTQGDATEWSFGVGTALLTAATFLTQILFLIVLCRKEGLGEAHFQWDSEMLAMIRKFLLWTIPLYLPGIITFTLIATDSDVTYLGSLGRLTGIVMILGLGTILALMMHPATGIAARVHELSPQSLFGKLRRLWFALITLGLGMIVVLLLIGFVFTGLLLILQLELTMAAVLAAFVVYGMILRWFLIAGRRLPRMPKPPLKRWSERKCSSRRSRWKRKRIFRR